MWPGCSTLLKGKRPTYEIAYSDDVTSDEKVDQVLDWLDLPYKERPQTISVYIPTVDQHGHKYGPYDNRVSYIMSIGPWHKHPRSIEFVQFT
jgi:predicted AlkP superfamily pyrophosphatase or phosphodiesterase